MERQAKQFDSPITEPVKIWKASDKYCAQTAAPDTAFETPREPPPANATSDNAFSLQNNFILLQ